MSGSQRIWPVESGEIAAEAVTPAKLDGGSLAILPRAGLAGPVWPIFVDPCDVVGAQGSGPGKWGHGVSGCAVSLNTDPGGRCARSTLSAEDSAVGAVQIYANAGVSTCSCYMYYDAGQHIDITDCHMVVDYMILDDDDAPSLTVDLSIYTTDSGKSRHWRIHRQIADAEGAWLRWVGTPSGFYEEHGVFNPADVYRVQIDADFTNGKRPKILIDRIMFIRNLADIGDTGATNGVKWPPSAVYCYTGDDSRAEQWQMAAYLASYGIRGTFFAVPATMTVDGYTLAQARLMRQMGHRFVPHSPNSAQHTAYGGYTTAERLASYKQAVRDMVDLGLIDASDVYRPAGSWWDYVNDPSAIADLYLRQVALTTMPAAGAQASVAGDTKQLWSPAHDPYTYCYVSDSQALADAGVARAITDHGHCIVLFHGAGGTGEATWANWKTHIDTTGAQVLAGNIFPATLLELHG